jgi:Tfp pilus assembly protein FimT
MELVIVISIIPILLLTAIPTVDGMREKTDETSADNPLRAAE